MFFNRSCLPDSDARAQAFCAVATASSNRPASAQAAARVKAAVAAANVEIYDRIFRLAELKGLATTLNALDTKAGVFHEGRGFAEASYEVEYVAQLGKVDVDKLVAELNAEIQSLQDALDEFNFTRSVNL